MAKFMIMQWDWMGPIVLRIDETEAAEASSVPDRQPTHPVRPMSIVSAIAGRFAARHRHGD